MSNFIQNMFTKKSIIIILVLLLGGSLFFAVQSSSTRKIPSNRFERILQLVGEFLEQGHFNPKKIDDAFSKEVFNKFLASLDPDKTYFMAGDIQKFKNFETTIDNEIHGSSLESFYMINEVYKKRVEESAVIYKDILSKPFDFTVNETYLADGEKLSFPQTDAARKDAWRKKLKYYTLERYVDLIEEQEKAKGKEGTTPKSNTELEQEARAKVLKLMDRMYDRFRNRFKDEDRFNLFVNDITETMDPHTTYFPPIEKRSFDEQMSGEFFGIGASLTEEDDNIKIATIVKGSPADKSGEIQIGDFITKVAQGNEEPQDLTGYEVPDAVRLIRGKKGTEVRLTVKKANGTIKVISLIREKINLEETFAKSTIIKGPENYKIGYIYLPEFYANFQDANGARSADDVAKEILKLKQEGINGIILDLRNNGGGSLMDVVKMVGFFIDEGPVVQVKSRDENPTILKDRDKTVLWDGPLTVMVNEFSASASEIFAAAIQDYKRGLVIGSTSTYGKGTVQRSIQLERSNWTSTSTASDLGDIKLTLQKFYRITGASTQLKGVVSDIVLPDQYEYLKFREKDDQDALSWDEIISTQYKNWKNDYDLNTIVQRSNERIKENKSFQQIKEKTNWLEKINNKQYSLNIVKYRQDSKNLSNVIKTIDTLTKLQTPLTVINLAVDEERIKGDTFKEERNTAFINRLKRDLHLGETVNVMNDMIQQYFIALNNQSQRIKN